ncbi:ATP-binding protein [Candidatus Woesearchaeota archaeon]|nr:ATP-binding protein [Candidatus Woesearchaeota archaeon]
MKYKTLKINNEFEAIHASELASNIAIQMGFGKLESSQITLAVSEIAGNAVKFAGKGTVNFNVKKNKRVLEVVIKDKGPGISKNNKIVGEGYKFFKTSLGVGLKAAERAMDEFFIKSKPGKGTTVVMRKFLHMPDDEIEYGVVSLNDEQNIVNGDSYVIKEFDGDKVLLSVIDGLGEGPVANKAANFVKDFIEDNYRLNLTKMVVKCDKYFRKQKKKKNGDITAAVFGLFLLKSGSLEYLGIGDTNIRVISKKKISLFSKGGLVGEYNLPALNVQKEHCGREIIVIMHTDGISDRFTDDILPLNQSAQKIADFIMNKFRREYGDATILVLKRKK